MPWNIFSIPFILKRQKSLFSPNLGFFGYISIIISRFGLGYLSKPSIFKVLCTKKDLMQRSFPLHKVILFLSILFSLGCPVLPFQDKWRCPLTCSLYSNSFHERLVYVYFVGKLVNFVALFANFAGIILNRIIFVLNMYSWNS